MGRVSEVAARRAEAVLRESLSPGSPAMSPNTYLGEEGRILKA